MATASTQFTCPDCRKVLRTASPPAPGKRVRCPGCGSIFSPHTEEPRPAAAIRQAAPEYGAPARRRAEADGEPSPRRASSPRRDDFDDDADYRPRRRSQGGGGLVLMLGGSVAILLVAALAVAAFLWPGFLRS